MSVAVRFGELAALEFPVLHDEHLDLLFADLAPARHLGRVIHVRGPAMDHVARTDFVQQLLRFVDDVFERLGLTGKQWIE